MAPGLALARIGCPMPARDAGASGALGLLVSNRSPGANGTAVRCAAHRCDPEGAPRFGTLNYLGVQKRSSCSMGLEFIGIMRMWGMVSHSLSYSAHS
jgi:hypothetical protein